MATISAIRQYNSAFTAKKVAGPVAVFVGGTSGIGEITMKAYAKATVSPTIYFVGRNDSAGTKIKEEIEKINSSANVKFIKSDLSLLENVKKAADEILEKEKSINLLFLTQGFLSLAGREETPEGLDYKMVVNHYGRALFTKQLLPQLKNGAQTTPLGARVISVYAPGDEGPIFEDDLELKKNFSVTMAAKVLTAYQTYTAEHLSKTNPDIGFSHASPGAVMTGLWRGLPWYARLLYPLASPFSTSHDDSAQGFLWLATREEGKTGLHLVDWKGKNMDTRNKAGPAMSRIGPRGLNGWWKEGFAEKVWNHTEEIFKRVLQS